MARVGEDLWAVVLWLQQEIANYYFKKSKIRIKITISWKLIDYFLGFVRLDLSNYQLCLKLFLTNSQLVGRGVLLGVARGSLNPGGIA